MFERERFLFAIEDKKYVVGFEDHEINMTLSSLQFWSRKDLGDEFPPNYSLVIQGETKQEGNGSVIEMDLTEYHGNHPHKLGGQSIDKYLKELAKDLLFR